MTDGTSADKGGWDKQSLSNEKPVKSSYTKWLILLVILVVIGVAVCLLVFISARIRVY